jgi:hypothetical protein
MIVVAFVLELGSTLVNAFCSNLCISSINYDTRRKVFGSLKIYYIHGF